MLALVVATTSGKIEVWQRVEGRLSIPKGEEEDEG